MAEVSIHWAGREVAGVAHVAVTPPPGGVRAHLATESGLTIVDVEVTGGTTTLHAESALAGTRGFAAVLASDLDRVWGSRSLFGLPDPIRATATLRGDASGRIAAETADGSWIVAAPEAFTPRPGFAPVDVLLVDRAGRDEMLVRYGDFDASGIPRIVSVKSLRDERLVTIDVVSTSDTSPPPGAPADGTSESR